MALPVFDFVALFPREISFSILNELDLQTIVKVLRISKKWRNFISIHERSFARRLFKDIYAYDNQKPEFQRIQSFGAFQKCMASDSHIETFFPRSEMGIPCGVLGGSIVSARAQKLVHLSVVYERADTGMLPVLQILRMLILRVSNRPRENILVVVAEDVVLKELAELTVKFFSDFLVSETSRLDYSIIELKNGVTIGIIQNYTLCSQERDEPVDDFLDRKIDLVYYFAKLSLAGEFELINIAERDKPDFFVLQTTADRYRFFMPKCLDEIATYLAIQKKVVPTELHTTVQTVSVHWCLLSSEVLKEHERTPSGWVERNLYTLFLKPLSLTSKVLLGQGIKRVKENACKSMMDCTNEETEGTSPKRMKNESVIPKNWEIVVWKQKVDFLE